jgi:ribosome-associated protein
MNTSMLPDLTKECVFATSRSSGPGGQHVNKTETKVELRINIVTSMLLSEDQKTIILQKYSDKLVDQGTSVKITCQTSRSQATNKKIALQKLYTLLETWLVIDTPRIATKIPAVVKIKRLAAKKQTAKIKALRGKPKNDMMDE